VARPGLLPPYSLAPSSPGSRPRPCGWPAASLDPRLRAEPAAAHGRRPRKNGPRSTKLLGPARRRSSLPGTYTTTDSSTASAAKPSPPSPPHPAPAPSTTSCAPAAPASPPPCGNSPNRLVGILHGCLVSRILWTCLVHCALRRIRLRSTISGSAARAALLINSWVPVLIVCRYRPMSVQPRWNAAEHLRRPRVRSRSRSAGAARGSCRLARGSAGPPRRRCRRRSPRCPAPASRSARWSGSR
jgi:hypothetical protein